MKQQRQTRTRSQLRLQLLALEAIAILALGATAAGQSQQLPSSKQRSSNAAPASNSTKTESKPAQENTAQAASATSASARTDRVGSFVSMENKNAMRITLKTSRGQATAGSNFGITAEIENTSSQPIYIMPSTIAMTVPPELDTGGVHDLWAFIPGIQESGLGYWNTVIVLEPGSTTSGFWSSGNESGSPESNNATGWIERMCNGIGLDCGKFFRGLGFSPGTYTLNVVGSYWDTYQGAQIKSIERHTQTAQIQETITAPQSVILLGAALGGIIAFLLLTKLQPASGSGWASVRWVPGILSAVLLSMIVTILIARLSQSQFIISVTVNDLWGAIAVGFIVTAAGPTILRKFTDLVSAPSAGPARANASQNPANVVTSPAASPVPGNASQNPANVVTSPAASPVPGNASQNPASVVTPPAASPAPANASQDPVNAAPPAAGSPNGQQAEPLVAQNPMGRV
jgi:hypothetical protein